jgi:hypothetical protein
MPLEVWTVLSGEQKSLGRPPVSRKTTTLDLPRCLGLASLLAVLVTVFLPSPVYSQAVKGHVIDDLTSEGIDGVLVTLLRYGREGRTALTDSTGSFFLPLPGRGPYSLEAERLGYATSRSRRFIAELTDTISVEFRLNMEAILLDPLVVTAVDGRGESRFERHQVEWGKGVFMTPEMVDSIQPGHPADVFRGQEKTRFTWGFSQKTNKAIPKIRTYLGTGCLAYMVNFFPVIPPRWDPPVRGRAGSQFADVYRTSIWENTILELVDGEDLVAVEYYRHISEVPPDLRNYAMMDEDISGRGGLSAVQNCGLVVFWTADGW